MSWAATFKDLMSYLHRDCGYRIPFILRRRMLWPIGIAPVRRASNDNRVRR